MQGKSEFEVTGNLKDWERWDRLNEIRVKALTIGSNHDEMDPADLRKNGDAGAECDRRHLHIGLPSAMAESAPVRPNSSSATPADWKLWV